MDIISGADFEQIIDPNDDSIYMCSSVSSQCFEYLGAGEDICALAGGTVGVPCCTSVDSFINKTCSGTQTNLLKMVRDGLTTF